MAINKFQGEFALYGQLVQINLDQTFSRINSTVESNAILVNGVDTVELDDDFTNDVLDEAKLLVTEYLNLPITSVITSVPQSRFKGDVVIYANVLAVDIEEPLDEDNIEIKLKGIVINGNSIGKTALLALDPDRILGFGVAAKAYFANIALS